MRTRSWLRVPATQFIHGESLSDTGRSHGSEARTASAIDKDKTSGIMIGAGGDLDSQAWSWGRVLGRRAVYGCLTANGYSPAGSTSASLHWWKSAINSSLPVQF